MLSKCLPTICGKTSIYPPGKHSGGLFLRLIEFPRHSAKAELCGMIFEFTQKSKKLTLDFFALGFMIFSSLVYRGFVVFTGRHGVAHEECF